MGFDDFRLGRPLSLLKLGLGAATVMRRMGPLGLVAAAVGGYAFKRYSEKRDANRLR